MGVGVGVGVCVCGVGRCGVGSGGWAWEVYGDGVGGLKWVGLGWGVELGVVGLGGDGPQLGADWVWRRSVCTGGRKKFAVLETKRGMEVSEIRRF